MIDYKNIDYKKLIEDFCKDSGYSQKQTSYILRPCVYEKKLFQLMPYQYGELIVKDMCGLGGKKGSKSPGYLIENYRYLVSFFNWCISKKYIDSNPFIEITELSTNNLIKQMVNEMKINVLYDDTLHQYVNKSQNKEFFAMIIGLLYDGVKSNNEVAAIKLGDIDLEQRTLTLKDRKINLSTFTVEAITKYETIEIFYVERIDGVTDKHEYVRYKDYLIKRTQKTKVENEDKFVKYTATILGNNLKKIDLTYIDVYRSGLLSRLRKAFCKFNDAEFSEIILSDKKVNTGVANIFKSVIGKNRIDIIRDMCIPYLVESKYYQK